MTTSPGWSSRSTDTTVKQLPQRDAMDDAQMTPGWSNSQAVTGDDDAKVVDHAEAKVMTESDVEDKAVARKSTAAKRKS